jgi:FkbM family methyltransferase
MMLKSIAAHLPGFIQTELKRAYFRRKIRRNEFSAGEPEFDRLNEFIRAGDTVIDVGANVGHYTRRMSELVGPAGRVIALEPMATTFALLTSNCADLRNVTLLNLAASENACEVGMELPHFASGLENYYRASITPGGTSRAMAIALDSLTLERLALIKIDAEGHDLEVLRGASGHLQRLRPKLIVEADAQGKIAEWLVQAGYRTERREGSPNLVAQAQ